MIGVSMGEVLIIVAFVIGVFIGDVNMVGALVGDGFSVRDWWPFVVSGDEQRVEVGPKKSYI